MHKLIYQGNNNYQCVNCGLGATRDLVTKFVKTSCSGQDNLVKINKKLAGLDQKVKDMAAYQVTTDEAVQDMANRVEQLEREPAPPGTD